MEGGSEERVFDSAILAGGRVPWAGLAGSLLSHVVIVPLLAFGFQQAVRRPVLRRPLTVTPLARYQIVTLKLPSDLMRKPPAPRRVEVVEVDRPEPAPSKKIAAPTAAEPAPPPVARVEVAIAPPKARPKAFPMPSESKAQSTEVVILQPPSERTLMSKIADVALPSITMVAPSPPRMRTVFDVGSLQKRRSMPKNPEPGPLPEPPQMTTETVAIRPKPSGLVEPKLGVYAAPPPMEMIRARDRGEPSAGGPVVENPANLAMSSSKPVPARETVEVPAAIVLPQSGTGAAGVGGGIPAAGSPAGRAGGVVGGVPGAKGTGSRPTEEKGTGAKGSGGGSSANGNSAASGNGVEPGPVLPDAEPPVRIVHPSTGRHDVLILHSGVDQILPEARGLLEGDPVYTVYLNVGWTREWILHYCIPRSGPPGLRQVGGVVSLEAPLEVRAPYPIVTTVPSQRLVPPAPVLPPGQIGGRKRAPLLFYGYMDAKGDLVGMRQKGADDTGLGARILKSLEAWDLRPATKGDVPTRVQVILVVPLG